MAGRRAGVGKALDLSLLPLRAKATHGCKMLQVSPSNTWLLHEVTTVTTHIMSLPKPTRPTGRLPLAAPGVSGPCASSAPLPRSSSRTAELPLVCLCPHLWGLVLKDLRALLLVGTVCMRLGILGSSTQGSGGSGSRAWEGQSCQGALWVGDKGFSGWLCQTKSASSRLVPLFHTHPP